jgi:mRNA interferase YafQ
MNINIISSTKFDKEFKLMLKRGKKRESLNKVIDLLLDNANKDIEPHLLLPIKYKLHKLSGRYHGYWECHIEPDWLLLYYLDNESLRLESTGTHSDIFK